MCTLLWQYDDNWFKIVISTKFDVNLNKQFYTFDHFVMIYD